MAHSVFIGNSVISQFWAACLGEKFDDKEILNSSGLCL